MIVMTDFCGVLWVRWVGYLLVWTVSDLLFSCWLDALDWVCVVMWMWTVSAMLYGYGGIVVCDSTVRALERIVDTKILRRTSPDTLTVCRDICNAGCVLAKMPRNSEIPQPRLQECDAHLCATHVRALGEPRSSGSKSIVELS